MFSEVQRPAIMVLEPETPWEVGVARSGSQGNRWGDPELGRPRPVSGMAVLAMILCVAPYAAGLSYFVLSLCNSVVDNLLLAVPLSVLEFVLLLSALGLPIGMVLAYAALVTCHIDGPRSGRSLAWIALPPAYLLLFLWYAAFAELIGRDHRYSVYALAAILSIHLLVYAAESRAGRYLFGGLLFCGVLFSLASGSLLVSREEARRSQCAYDLMRLGTALGMRQVYRPVQPQLYRPLEPDERLELLDEDVEHTPPHVP